MHSFFKLVYYLPFAMVLNGVFFGVVLSQDVADSSTSISRADTLDGIKFIYKPPAEYVSHRNFNTPTGLYSLTLGDDQITTSWDSVDTYKIERTIQGYSLFTPSITNFAEYAQMKRKEQEVEIRQQLIEEGKNEVDQGRGLLDFSLNIPGGESSVFTTIFGKPEVNLRVNGSANMNVGVSVQNIDDPQIEPELQRRIDPTFNQNLQLNIQGTIGDKLTIATDWDTERAFDFHNRLSIVYQGYEDEIIKRIELGNVSMETGNSLIRGGASLFGIKSIAELGPLRLTTVISQQKGESETQTISGGSQETPISIQPAEYQNNRHFFIDFYNRQEFESNVSNPQQYGQAYQIADIRVWISEPQVNTTDPEAIRAAAFVDLGVVDAGNGSYALPNPALDNIDDNLLATNRNNTSASAESFGVPGSDFYNGYFRPLQEGVDYRISKSLGYISLNRSLSSGSFLAVSFIRVAPNGESVEVGDISPQSSGLTYLKLLRSNNPTPDQKSWPLTMRNVYSLGVANVSQGDLDIDIKFTQGNIEQSNLEGRVQPLLRELGLDRVNTEGAPNPDNLIDFTGIAIDASTGNIVFPYLEPFGERINELLLDASVSDSVREALTYYELYNQKQSTADQSTKNNFYEIEGISRGGITGSFSLGFSLVEGSVNVFANGTELTEGVDYEVDYSFGLISILNEKYLASGQDIRIEYENNQLAAIGQKNFTGLRAEYQVSDDISIGSTYFKLKEQPLSDKIRIGNESINNTVIGMDADANFDTPWITRFIDRIPLLQTIEPSNISISGEIAQLRPGVAHTNAVRDAIENNVLFSDEEEGISFIDDFEGSEFSITLLNPSRWNLAAPPAAVPGYEPDEAFFENPLAVSPLNSPQSKRDRADLRGQFSWYTIPRNISSFLDGVQFTPESQIVLTEDVFPGRETNNTQEEVINTLDVHFDPTKRGPYNYNMDLKNQLEQFPEEQWGGMMATLPSGQEDLTQNNIEFIEFWVQPILPNGEDPLPADIENYDGKIYIDLGTISEDIIPNFQLNTEDGLATNLNSLVLDDFNNPRSYVPGIQTAPQGQFSNENRQYEDVGLDGVPSANGFDEEKVETALFSQFIDSMRVAYGEDSEEFTSIFSDPSNDDYVFYAEGKVQDLPLQERFYRVYGYHEGNTPVSGGESRAITTRPDSEGLTSQSNIQQNNAYYQYEIDLNPADFNNLEIGSPNTYIIDKVPGSRQQDRWHLVRIPLEEFTRKVGDIDGFQNIQYIRIWMSGYEEAFTLRFATLEFIGSQWRKVAELEENEASTADFRVSTINIEENANREPVPYRQPVGSIRSLNRGVQVNSLANEQSLVLAAEGLGPGELQMVKKVYPGGLNLLNYRNMRMFVHGEGYGDGPEEREHAELVIRMGTDLEANYYEYRQPVTPSDPNYSFSTYTTDGGGDLEGDAEEVWLYDENSMKIVLSAFNELKQLRDQQTNVDVNQEFSTSLNPEDEDVADGAVVAIKGNPSLGRVTEIGMGIRNPYDPSDINSQGVQSLDAEFWLNELRVAGFDNEKGWSANAKASIKLADFATVNSNFTRTTSGFGGLESRLGQRSVADEIGYDLSSTVNLHKLIPDRFGWSFPVTVSTRKSVSTPKFLPGQGDIRLDDFINATQANDELTRAEKDARIDNMINEVETVQDAFSLNFSNISKSNSKSKLAQHTIDKIRLSHVYNEGSSSNPELQLQNSWNFNTSIQYSHSFNNLKMFRPFKFTEGVPVAEVLSGLRLGYMPSSINASASMNRSYNEKRRRPQLNNEGNVISQPLQQSHVFNQRSSFGFSYNLTPTIPISFRSNTNYDLSRAGREDANISGVDSSRFRTIPTFEVLSGIIADTLSARRSKYEETYSTSWRPQLNKIKALNWLTYSASYAGGFSWQNSAQGSNLGAGVSNTFRLDNTLKLDTRSLFEKFDFYTNMEDADNKESRARKQARESDEKREPDLFKDIQYLGRKLVLGIFSMDNIDISYKKNKTASQAGYSGGSQIFQAFGDQSGNYSPPFGYRIGLNEELPRSQLIRSGAEGSTIALPKRISYSDNLTWGTKIQLFDNLSVDLDWSTRWDETNHETISLSPTGDFSSTLDVNGQISSSVWAFGSGYGDLFERQLETAFADMDGSNIISDESGNNDGRLVLNRNTLEEDFRKAYLGGNTGAIGEKGYTPFPKPGWRVTWSGVEDLIPFIGNKMNRATLTHQYNGSYKLGWNMNQFTGQKDPEGFGAFSILDYRDEFEPASINVEQRFSPLVQLNVTWSSGLRTQIGVDRSKTSSLALSSRTVSERVSQGLKLSLNYSFKKVRIPFFPKIKNNIDLTINGGIADDSDQKFQLIQDLEYVLRNGTDLIPDADQYDYTVPLNSGQTRLNGSVVIGYRFSQTVTSNFEYTFSKVNPKSSLYPPRTNHDIRFNFRIAIQSR